jgi:hypothetical protein
VPVKKKSSDPMTLMSFQNLQPQSVVWGRTDGGSLPGGVAQENNDLVIRNPSHDQAGNYVCTITHPDGSTELIPVQLVYPGGTVRPPSEREREAIDLNEMFSL